MTTAQQDRDFIGYIINSSLLEEAVEWIAKNLNPDDVFAFSKLADWASDNGFMEEPPE